MLGTADNRWIESIWSIVNW